MPSRRGRKGFSHGDGCIGKFLGNGGVRIGLTGLKNLEIQTLIISTAIREPELLARIFPKFPRPDALKPG